jgi:predicted nuclease with TOPRIM domain
LFFDSLPIGLRESMRRARERIEGYEEECSRLGMMVTEHASSVEEQRERIKRMEDEHEGVVDALRAEVVSAPTFSFSEF